jgi:hypothetical protein
MSSGTKAGLASLLKVAAWLLLAIGALAFWVAGAAINGFVGTPRIIAEAEGLGLAALLLLSGAIAKIVATRLEKNDGNISLSDSPRK